GRRGIDIASSSAQLVNLGKPLIRQKFYAHSSSPVIKPPVHPLPVHRVFQTSVRKGPRTLKESPETRQDQFARPVEPNRQLRLRPRRSRRYGYVLPAR